MNNFNQNNKFKRSFKPKDHNDQNRSRYSDNRSGDNYRSDNRSRFNDNRNKFGDNKSGFGDNRRRYNDNRGGDNRGGYSQNRDRFNSNSNNGFENRSSNNNFENRGSNNNFENRNSNENFRSRGYGSNNSSGGNYESRRGGGGNFSYRNNNNSGRSFGQSRGFGGGNRRGGGGFRNDYNSDKYQYNPSIKLSSIKHLDLLKKAVLEVLMEDSLAMPLNVLVNKTIRKVKATGLDAYLREEDIVAIVHDYQKNEIVKTNMRGKYYLGYFELPEIPNSNATGTITMNHNGFGFIDIRDENNKPTTSHYVNKHNTMGAFDGDTVEYVLLDNSVHPHQNDKIKHLNDAKVIKILSHAKDNYVGEIVKDLTHEENAHKLFLKADNPKIKELILVSNPDNVVEGHKVLLKITDFTQNNLKGEIVQVLGHKNDVGVDILSIVFDHDIQVKFPKTVDSEIKTFDYSLDHFKNQSCRKNLVDRLFVTIDPATSKDFDDAIYVKKENDHFFLSVAIADVASYVPLHSGLNQVAEERGTSVYLVNSVIPMLPFVLSNDLCSLNPNEERCALVCDMKVNLDGSVDFDSAIVYPAIIKSHRRYSYDEVNDYYKKENMLENDSAELKAMLDNCHELFFLMNQEKERRGYIDFNIPEPKIILDENNKPVEIKIYKTWHAQQMIENFMIAANESVTFFAEKNKVPFIYRVHDKPYEDLLMQFALKTKALGFNISTSLQDVQPSDIAKWLKENHNNKYLNIIGIMLLRCMAKAVYSHLNTNHFGLASSHYTHFTSPIRRYPDVLAHRLFWMYLFEPEKYTNSERMQIKDRIEELATLSSHNELKAVQTERAVNSYKFTEYMVPKVGQQFEGTVTTVTSKGVFVSLDNLVEGFAPARVSERYRFVYNEAQEMFVDERYNAHLTLATRVKVELISANLEMREITFKILDIISNPF